MSKMNKKLPALFLTLVLVLGMTRRRTPRLTLIPQSPKKCFATMQSLRQKTSPMM